MSSAPRIDPVRFDEFCFLVKDGQKADLIDGVIYMASPDNTDANDLFVWLISLMHDFAELKDLGKVYGSRVAFKLDRTNSPEPDIGFVRKRRLRRVKRGHVMGPPDLAVEIVSPESIDRDYLTKRAQYEEFGVREYWIIDEMRQAVLLLRRTKAGTFRAVHPRKGILESKVLSGFWIRTEWLWPKTRPMKMHALNAILSAND